MSIRTAVSNKTLKDGKQEGRLTQAVEVPASRMPRDLFLWSAFGAIGLSLFLQMRRKKEESLFVGQWVAPFFMLDIYNKLVRRMGSR